MIAASRLACKLLTRQGFAFSIATPQSRHISTAQSLIYDAYGVPADVLQLRDLVLPPVGPDQALVEFMAAPINPSDINTIEGKYPIKPPLPAVPGNEGVGVVREVGSEVTNVRVGDAVVPLDSGLGTWRQTAVLEAAALHTVLETLAVGDAATISIKRAPTLPWNLPPTAIRLLEAFVALQPGDTVIQNGANSAVGRIVIQLCHAGRVNTINVVRDRPGLQALTDDLMGLGATVVTTEEDLKACLREGGLPPPALALNCVGGTSGTAIAKALRYSGTMVTYGGMSMKPVSVPTSLLIFKDLRLLGFWSSSNTSLPVHEIRRQRAVLVDRAAAMYSQGLILQPVADQDHVALKDYKRALEQQQQNHSRGKTLFKLRDWD